MALMAMASKAVTINAATTLPSPHPHHISEPVGIPFPFIDLFLFLVLLFPPGGLYGLYVRKYGSMVRIGMILPLIRGLD